MSHLSIIPHRLRTLLGLALTVAVASKVLIAGGGLSASTGTLDEERLAKSLSTVRGDSAGAGGRGLRQIAFEF